MPVNAPNNKMDLIAPNFKLLSTDGNHYNLEDVRGKKGTVVAFICNHCPYVISIAKRLSYEARELKKIGVNLIAIMSNDVNAYPEDSYEKMILFTKKYNFNFPYLYDETQEVAKNYNAVCTPDIFGFNNSLNLKYRGRIDSGSRINENLNIKRELFYAMELIVNKNIKPKNQINSIGCSIKWKTNE